MVLGAKRSDRSSAVRAFSGIAFLLFPAVSLLLAGPLIVEGSTWVSLVRGELRPGMVGLLLVIVVAIVSVPGYFIAAFEEEKLRGLGTPGKVWVCSSLVGAGVASVVAIPLATVLAWPLGLFPSITLLLCFVLGRRASRAWSQSEGERT